MITVSNIESLSSFQKNAKSLMARLAKTKQPVVLTVNGKAKVVVQDAEAYQSLMDEVEQVRLVAKLRAGLKQAEQGKLVPYEEVFAELSEEYGL